MYRPLLPCALVLACALPSSAATTGIDAFHTDNFAFASNPVLNELGTTLALGSVIQLGYFTISDVTDPLIWDTFVPLTGNGSNNAGFFDTRIGDGTDDPSPSGAGYWNLAANFDDGIHSDLSAGNVRVGVRIFNANTEAGATHFNTVTSSDAGWIMQAPNDIPPPNANASIDAAPPLTWQSGATGTFQTSLTLTTTAVPEASESLIVLLGLAGMLRHRRRR